MRQNDPEGVFFTAFVWIVSGIVFFWLQVRKQRRRTEVEQGTDLPDFAAVLGGEVARDPSFEGPFVRFTFQGVRCYAHQRMLNKSQAVVVSTLEARAGFPGFLQATSFRAIRRPMRSPRFHDVHRTEGFDIVSNDGAWAVGLLEAGLENILRDLRSYLGRGVRVQLAGDRINIEAEVRLTTPQVLELLEFMKRLILLARPGIDSAGIDFVGDVDFVQLGRCPVCSQELAQPGLRCELCRAPHHSDCWAYWGRCAIFGCSGRRAA